MVRIILTIIMILGSYIGFSQSSVTVGEISETKFEVSDTNLTFEIKLF